MKLSEQKKRAVQAAEVLKAMVTNPVMKDSLLEGGENDVVVEVSSKKVKWFSLSGRDASSLTMYPNGTFDYTPDDRDGYDCPYILLNPDQLMLLAQTAAKVRDIMEAAE